MKSKITLILSTRNSIQIIFVFLSLFLCETSKAIESIDKIENKNLKQVLFALKYYFNFFSKLNLMLLIGVYWVPKACNERDACARSLFKRRGSAHSLAINNCLLIMIITVDYNIRNKSNVFFIIQSFLFLLHSH
jgi:hypothetical protein